VYIRGKNHSVYNAVLLAGKWPYVRRVYLVLLNPMYDYSWPKLCIYIHHIWPYIRRFSCQKYHIYTVCIWSGQPCVRPIPAGGPLCRSGRRPRYTARSCPSTERKWSNTKSTLPHATSRQVTRYIQASHTLHLGKSHVTSRQATRYIQASHTLHPGKSHVTSRQVTRYIQASHTLHPGKSHVTSRHVRTNCSTLFWNGSAPHTTSRQSKLKESKLTQLFAAQFFEAAHFAACYIHDESKLKQDVTAHCMVRPGKSK